MVKRAIMLSDDENLAEEKSFVVDPELEDKPVVDIENQ